MVRLHHRGMILPMSSSSSRPPRVAAGGFAAAAPTYARIRPTYPRSAIGEIKSRIPKGGTILDVAAGTGILSGQLRRANLRVVAVEPLGEMLEQLRRTLPDLSAARAVAEALPLRDGSVQAVTVGEALHWFDTGAVPEMRRVLCPGGLLAVLRNRRDESVRWMAEYGEMLRSELGGSEPYERRNPAEVIAEAGGFDPAEVIAVSNPRPCTPVQLVERAASTSFVAAAPSGAREAVLDRVRELTRTHPDLAGRQSFDVPYVTELWMFEAT